MVSTRHKGRGLADQFLSDLQSGPLQAILSLVKADNTLSLNIRNNYVTVTYRGGTLMKITPRAKSGYHFSFDRKYTTVRPNSVPTAFPRLDYDALSPHDVETWLRQTPHLKFTMDIWFGQHPKPEREHQQIVERVNNHNYATDYFVCDVEYTHPLCPELRADLVAVNWPSTNHSRRKGYAPRLAIIEMKFGDGAIKSGRGSSGLVDHVEDIAKLFRSRVVSPRDLASEMEIVFNQRIQLGLIHCHSVKGAIMEDVHINGQRPEYVLLLTDHDPESTALIQELQALSSTGDLPFDIKVACANFAGYGLFSQSVYPIAEFCRHFRQQVSADDTVSSILLRSDPEDTHPGVIA